MHKFSLPIALAVTFVLQHSTFADFLIFSDAVAFHANADGAIHTEDFNLFVVDTEFVTTDLIFGLVTLSSNGGFNPSFDNPEALVDVGPVFGPSQPGIDGSPLLNSQGLDAGESITIGLEGPATAFAFDYENYDVDFDTLDVLINGELAATIPGDGVGFLGIVSDGAFESVTLLSNSTNDLSNGTFNGIDNLRFNTIPEPNSTVLILCLLGVLSARRRRSASLLIE